VNAKLRIYPQITQINADYDFSPRGVLPAQAVVSNFICVNLRNLRIKWLSNLR
jgi:hypothetical protein